MKKIFYLFLISFFSVYLYAKGKPDPVVQYNTDAKYPGQAEKIIQIDIKSPIAMTSADNDIFIIDKETGYIYRFTLNDRKIKEYIITPGTNPSSMTTDGKFLYVLDNDDKAIFKIDIQSKEMIKRLEIDVDSALAIAFGDGFLYINDLGKKTINRISSEDGTTVSSFPMPTAGKGRATEEYGMVYRNSYLYITDRNTDTIYQVYSKTGDVVNIYHIPELPFMTGITFFNNELYV
ncbi:MAG: hypothetical protein N3B13_03340, partial [Deltaproteobacteria bacterium]|nr:hypothetical protein [Deltaproteobacteria bacterium]